MNPVEECLKSLQGQNWTELNKILSNNSAATSIAESPTFSIFENIFIAELRRLEHSSNEDLTIVAARVFQIHQHKDSKFKLSKETEIKIAKYLFDKNPSEVYAKVLVNDAEAQKFLINHNQKIQKEIVTSQIGANLNVKMSEAGNLVFEKEIFNSPQERELFIAAKKVLPNSILLPNAALSAIIDANVCELLDKSTTSFFYKSTLDLCIVSAHSFIPELFIELDSSWHDKPKAIDNDKKKDEIFKKAGLTLYRLRKKENKEMVQIFELFINEIYASQQ